MSKSTKTPKGSAARKPYSADRVRSEAAKAYAAGTPLPEAIRKLDARAGRPTIALVSAVYWRLLGESNPIPGKTAAARRNALVRRRKSGVRFEVLAASLGAALGRSVSVSEVRTALASGGLDPETSYAGRGTRRSAAGEAARTVAPTT